MSRVFMKPQVNFKKCLKSAGWHEFLGANQLIQAIFAVYLCMKYL